MTIRFLFCVITALITPRIASAADPQANPAAIVEEGNARFTVLTSQLIRLEYSASARFQNAASLTFINRNLPVPDYKTTKHNGWLVLTTDYLSLRYKLNSGSFNARNLAIEIRDSNTVWHPEMDNTGNLGGTARTVDGFEGKKKLADGSVLTLEDGLLSRDGWSLIEDSATPLLPSGIDKNQVAARKGDATDWYFFGYGQQYKKALKDFTRVAGRIPLPPRYALGYWWSRYWVYGDAELRDLVSTLRQYNIPLDVLIIDMDWHKTWGLTANNSKPTPFGGMLGWTGYSWNKALFPEPEAFLNWTESEHLKVALNLHPADGIAPEEDRYDAMLGRLTSPALKEGWIPYALADKEWSDAYFDEILRPLEQQGVDFWWLDWQQWPQSKIIPSLNNTFWLNHSFFTDMEQHYPDKRPLLFHRWGGLGNHRYQVGFSGDAVISWSSLEFQPAFTATAANVGYGYWSHDIGGHIVNDKNAATSGELYLRWIQFGAFSPILRTHSSKTDIAERRIWRYPDYFDAMREAIHLRYQLAPYLYNAAWQAWDTGISMVRPMYYDFPEQEAAYHAPQQYMFGDNLLVAPVTTQADKTTTLASQTIWLPAGKWFDLSRNALLHSDGEIVTGRYTLDEIPLFAQAGSIIPRYPLRENLQSVPETLELLIIPGGDGSLRLFEDDGNSMAYQNGGGSFTSVNTDIRDNGISVTIAAVEGDYTGRPEARRYKLTFPMTLPAQTVRVNGKAIASEALHYDGSTLSQMLTLPLTTTNETLHVEVDFGPAWQQEALKLSGIAGQFSRLKTLAERLKLMSARNDWGATIPADILYLIETPTRLHYSPAKTAQYLAEFTRKVARLESQIAAMPQISAEEANALTETLTLFTGENGVTYETN